MKTHPLFDKERNFEAYNNMNSGLLKTPCTLFTVVQRTLKNNGNFKQTGIIFMRRYKGFDLYMYERFDVYFTVAAHQVSL